MSWHRDNRRRRPGEGWIDAVVGDSRVDDNRSSRCPGVHDHLEGNRYGDADVYCPGPFDLIQGGVVDRPARNAT